MQISTKSPRPWGLLALIAATAALAIGYATLARRHDGDALEKAERDLDFTDTSLGDDGDKQDDDDAETTLSTTRHPAAGKPANAKKPAADAGPAPVAADGTATIETIDEEDMMGETIDPPLD